MGSSLQEVNLVAVLVSFIAAQVLSTVWFTVLFGDAWAREFGADTRQEHTKAIPGWTYAVQAACTLALVGSIAWLQQGLGIESVGAALGLGLVLALGLCAANLVPGQAFLQRWRVAAITVGCQSAMILAISLILGVWR